MKNVERKTLSIYWSNGLPVCWSKKLKYIEIAEIVEIVEKVEKVYNVEITA